MPTTEKSRPVSIRLGSLADVFRVQCKRKGVMPNDAIRDLVGRTIREQQTPFPLGPKARTSRMRVTLGNLSDAFGEWCDSRRLTQSGALRELITQEIAISLLGSQNEQWPQLELGHESVNALIGSAPSGQARLGVLEQSDEKARLRLRLRPSELGALERLATQRRVTTQRLVTQIVRAFMLNIAMPSEQEAIELGAINHALMQLAHQLERIEPLIPNASVQQEISGCLQQVTAYVKASALALQASRQRWLIELRD